MQRRHNNENNNKSSKDSSSDSSSDSSNNNNYDCNFDIFLLCVVMQVPYAQELVKIVVTTKDAGIVYMQPVVVRGT